MTKKNFLGIEPVSDAAIKILSVPLEETVSYGSGTSKAPSAIIEASHQVELYDEELELSPVDVGIDVEDPIKCKNREIADVLNDVEKKVSSISKSGKLPFIIGGEHSITPAAVNGIYDHHKEITVVQLDAHADLRPEYEGTKYSHASAMARVREILPAVQVGIRSLSHEEARNIKENNWPVFFAHNIHASNTWMDEAIAAIKTDKIYCSVDVDVFDSGILPETGTPEPGGLSWYDVTNFLRKLFKSKEVVGMDVMELAPKDGNISADFMIAKLVYKMIGYWTVGKKF